MGLPTMAQPPYSPELNPTERVFEEVRRRVEGRIYRSIEHKMEAVNAYLRKLESEPARVRSLAGCGTGSTTTSGGYPLIKRLYQSELVLGGLVALNADLTGPGTHPGGVVPGLHTQKHVHAYAKGLFDAEGHLRRQRGVCVEQVGERRPANAKNLGRPLHAQPQLLDDLRADEVARMRWRHAYIDVVVDHQW